jgi:hypothetical protein
MTEEDCVATDGCFFLGEAGPGCGGDDHDGHDHEGGDECPPECQTTMTYDGTIGFYQYTCSPCGTLIDQFFDDLNTENLPEACKAGGVKDDIATDCPANLFDSFVGGQMDGGPSEGAHGRFVKQTECHCYLFPLINGGEVTCGGIDAFTASGCDGEGMSSMGMVQCDWDAVGCNPEETDCGECPEEHATPYTKPMMVQILTMQSGLSC